MRLAPRERCWKKMGTEWDAKSVASFWECKVHDAQDALAHWKKHAEYYQRRCSILTGALNFYADEDSYAEEPFSGQCARIMNDRGFKAQEALESE
jgi:hypothetical protein